MRHAHQAGLRTTATMMYGTVETLEERIEHLIRLRELQDETGGFTAFITWSYQPEHTELGGGEATGVDYLRTLALARIVLDNFDNLQASWVTQGGKVGQLSLAYGANDMGSVMIEENVVRAAGAATAWTRSRSSAMSRTPASRPKRRNMHYEILGDPIFRERAVPRMLHLPSRGPMAIRAVAGDRPLRRAQRRGKEGAAHRSLIVHRAAWVLPIAAPPIRDGWVAVEAGRIVGCGGARPSVRRPRCSAAVRRAAQRSSRRS